MPYVKEFERTILDPSVDTLIKTLRGLETKDSKDVTAGNMNYVITRLCMGVLQDKLNYANLNSLVGMLECVKLEMYRRVAATYEDLKILENGDVQEYMEACGKLMERLKESMAAKDVADIQKEMDNWVDKIKGIVETAKKGVKGAKP